jgi:hypothetical protein
MKCVAVYECAFVNSLENESVLKISFLTQILFMKSYGFWVRQDHGIVVKNIRENS